MCKMFKASNKPVLTDNRLSVEAIHDIFMNVLENDDINQYLLRTCDILTRYHESKSEQHRGQLNVEYAEVCFSLFPDVYKKYVTDSTPSPARLSAIDKCQSCNSVGMLIEPGFAICVQCGLTVPNMDGVNCMVPYNQEIEKHVACPYRRSNHFNEWLAQYQGRMTSSVPNEVFSGVLMELKKERIYDMMKVNKKMLRAILKKLKMNKYYENIPYIMSQLQGTPPPIIPSAMEEQLKQMFLHIQPAFDKHCPPNRKNFLSYSYVIHKLCILIGEHERAQSFALLKSREKLMAQVMPSSHLCPPF